MRSPCHIQHVLDIAKSIGLTDDLTDLAICRFYPCVTYAKSHGIQYMVFMTLNFLYSSLKAGILL